MVGLQAGLATLGVTLGVVGFALLVEAVDNRFPRRKLMCACGGIVLVSVGGGLFAAAGTQGWWS